VFEVNSGGSGRTHGSLSAWLKRTKHRQGTGCGVGFCSGHDEIFDRRTNGRERNGWAIQIRGPDNLARISPEMLGGGAIGDRRLEFAIVTCLDLSQHLGWIE
jgi:hypothetical protein